MGRLDHVHVRVPNRAEAAGWYAEHLGFEPVERFGFSAPGNIVMEELGMTAANLVKEAKSYM